MKKIFLSLICGILLLSAATGCGNNSVGKDDSKANNITINAPEGLEVKTYISSGQDQLIVSVTNKSGKMIGSGYISVSYYDENDKKITIYGTDDIRYNMFENGREVVYGFKLPAENNLDRYIPARTEVEITIDEEYQEKYSHIMAEYVENFTYSYSTTDDTVTLTLKNNGSDSEWAPRTVSVVFYKNNRPVYSEEVWFWLEVEAGQTTSKDFDIPTDYKKSNESGQDVLIDYDSIKIFRVIEGHS